MEITSPLNICGYCGLPGITYIIAEADLGIIACEIHSGAAARDTKAFLHREKRVRIDHARLFFPHFFAALDAKPFNIKRSDGRVYSGWRVAEESLCVRDKRWCIVAKNDRGSTRFVPIDMFALRAVQLHNLSIADIEEVIETLDEGIYRVDAAKSAIAAAKS